jgi:hypothetical protein
VTGRMFIRGRLWCTFEVATYTILLLTVGDSKHGGIGSLIYFGIGGEAVCVTAEEKNDGGL